MRRDQDLGIQPESRDRGALEFTIIDIERRAPQMIALKREVGRLCAALGMRVLGTRHSDLLTEFFLVAGEDCERYLKITRHTTLLPVLVVLAGCGADRRVPVIDMAMVTPAELTAATNVRVFTTEQPPPKVEHAIGPPVTACSCKYLSTDAPVPKVTPFSSCN